MYYLFFLRQAATEEPLGGLLRFPFHTVWQMWQVFKSSLYESYFTSNLFSCHICHIRRSIQKVALLSRFLSCRSLSQVFWVFSIKGVFFMYYLFFLRQAATEVQSNGILPLYSGKFSVLNRSRNPISIVVSLPPAYGRFRSTRPYIARICLKFRVFSAKQPLASHHFLYRSYTADVRSSAFETGSISSSINSPTLSLSCRYRSVAKRTESGMNSPSSFSALYPSISQFRIAL